MARDMRLRSPQARAYVAAPILIGVAVLIRNALLGNTGGPEPDLLLLAVTIAGALGGLGPAAAATAVGLLEEIYFQTEPVRTFLVPRRRDQVELALFVASGIAIAITFEVVRRIRQRERAVGRTLAMITRCNEAILRARTEEELHADVCKVIVDVGGYPMCWVGLAEHDERKTVRPVAHAGHEDGYLGLADIVWADEPRGRGTVGTSIREKRMVVGQNFATDPLMAPWREEALRRGYRSVTCLPLILEGTVLGAIVMYSGEVAAFTDNELRYLQQLTDDVAFGVGAIRQRLATDRAVTGRAAAEHVLRLSEARLRRAEESAQVGHWEFSLDDKITHASDGALRIYGLARDKFHLAEAQALVLSGSRPVLDAALSDLIEKGAKYDIEFKIRRASDGKVVDIHSRAEYDPRDRKVFGIIQDVTSRKAADAERDALRTKLALASRLAAMGTLVAGVAHEINNPLTGVMAGVGTAMLDVQSNLKKLERGERLSPETWIERDREILEMLGEASEAAARIKSIVRDLSVFGAPTQDRARLRASDIVAGAMRWLPSSVHTRATVSVEDLGAPDVKASRGQLEQVLVNLLTNAAKATRPGAKGTILIRLGAGSPGMARLEVVDHGTGIDPVNLSKIFDPFFTTRPPGERRGTGLGLSICHAIITDHGGTITVETEVGKGSTFRVELPAAPVEPVAAPS